METETEVVVTETVVTETTTIRSALHEIMTIEDELLPQLLPTSIDMYQVKNLTSLSSA
jgi:hypothetical protein